MGSGKRKRIMTNYSFESTKLSNDGFTKICNSMYKSVAWKELSFRERGLYLHLKSKFTKRPDGSTNQDNISMPRKEQLEYYGSATTFGKDIDALIKRGFVKCIIHGKTGRRCNIYSFSDMWQKYNTDEFNLHPNDLRFTEKKK